jgi:protein transport protein HofC
MSLVKPIAAPTTDYLVWALVGVALVVAMLGGVFLSILVPAFGVFFVLSVATVVSGAVMFFRWRSARQEALLWSMAIAAERGMPLASVFDAVPAGSTQKLIVLREMLRSGAPLPQVLDVVRGVVPRDAEVLVHVGWGVGMLPGTLREAADLRSAQVPGRAALATRSAYFVFLLVVVQLISSFLLYFIMPKFQVIFRDFGVPLPWLTRSLLGGSQFLVQSTGPVLALVVLVEAALLLVLPFSIAGWWTWDLPLLDRLFRRKHAALVLRSLAWVVDANQPLSFGLALLVRSYPSTWVRLRLDQALHDVDCGGDCWDALLKSGLIRRSDNVLLTSAARAGNLAWALREAAASGERRFTYHAQLALQTLGTVVLIGVAALVFVTIAAYFLPLLTIMKSLEG